MSAQRNPDRRRFDVVQVTNEAPANRRGGVATIVDGLHRQLLAQGKHCAVLVIDHMHSEEEIATTLREQTNVVFGSSDDLADLTADIWHVHCYRYSQALIEHVRRVASLVTIHSLAAAETSSLPSAYGDDVLGQRRLIEAASMVALVSRRELVRYRELGYDVNVQPARVIYNGVSDPGWRAQHVGRRHLGFCGRLVARKHPEYVLRALAEPTFTDCRALIAGRPFSADMERWSARLGVDDRADFLGWCGGPRLERFYASIDVLLVPSSYEPSGLVAMEAAVRGIPVVCTPVDGLPETMGRAAFFAADDTYEAFLEALVVWQQTTDADLAALVEAARDRAIRAFSSEAMADRYVAAYRDVSDDALAVERRTFS